jgi:hypothetical protein
MPLAYTAHDRISNHCGRLYLSRLDWGLFETRKRWKKSRTWKSFIIDRNSGGENKQLQRASAICALFWAAIITGQCYKREHGVTTSLFVAATLKAMICALWCFWPREPSNEECFCQCDTLACSICSSNRSQELKLRTSGDTTPSLSREEKPWGTTTSARGAH